MTAPYHVALNLAGRKCVVVGGGRVGARKIAGLMEAGAKVLLVSPEATPELVKLANDGRIDWLRKHFAHPDVEGAFLVFAATDDPAANDLVALAASRKGVLVNVASVADGGDFLVPAVHRDGPVSVAVETGGAAPALSAHLRDALAKALPEGAGELAELLGRLKRSGGAWEEARENWLDEALKAGDLTGARERAAMELERGEKG